MQRGAACAFCSDRAFQVYSWNNCVEQVTCGSSNILLSRLGLECEKGFVAVKKVETLFELDLKCWGEKRPWTRSIWGNNQLKIMIMNFCTSDYWMKLKVKSRVLDFSKILVGDSCFLCFFITGDLSTLTGTSAAGCDGKLSVSAFSAIKQRTGDFSE